MLKSLDVMIQRVNTLKRKMETLHEEEKALHEASRQRLIHLQALYDMESLADVKYDEWSRVRLNRLLVEYLVRQGYWESAKGLAREKGIEGLVDLEVFGRCEKIGRSLRARNLEECLGWCAEHKVVMKKVDVSACSCSILCVVLADWQCHIRIPWSSSCACNNTLNFADKGSLRRRGNMVGNIFRPSWRTIAQKS